MRRSPFLVYLATILFIVLSFFPFFWTFLSS